MSSTKMTAPCRGCIYLGRAGNTPICEYILKTEHRRPCPPGAGCTVKQTEGGLNDMKTKTWDEAQARQLFAEGKSDMEVAEMVGTSRAAVRAWKRRNGLTKPRPPKTETASSEPKPSTDAAPAPSVTSPWPVELSISYNGCTVTLSAPDISRATWSGRYLLRLLEDIQTGLPEQANK